MEYLTTDADDKVRANDGVVVCLRDLGNGQSRLVFDDVVMKGEGNHRVWHHELFYTWNAYSNSLLDEMELSDDQYRDIGIALVARLLALNGRVK